MSCLYLIVVVEELYLIVVVEELYDDPRGLAVVLGRNHPHDVGSVLGGCNTNFTDCTFLS